MYRPRHPGETLTGTGKIGEGQQEACLLNVSMTLSGREADHVVQCIFTIRTLASTHKAGLLSAGTGFGTTAEQSMRSAGLWPMTAILLMAALNLDAMRASSSKSCQL